MSDFIRQNRLKEIDSVLHKIEWGTNKRLWDFIFDHTLYDLQKSEPFKSVRDLYMLLLDEVDCKNGFDNAQQKIDFVINNQDYINQLYNNLQRINLN